MDANGPEVQEHLAYQMSLLQPKNKARSYRKVWRRLLAKMLCMKLMFRVPGGALGKNIPTSAALPALSTCTRTNKLRQTSV